MLGHTLHIHCQDLWVCMCGVGKVGLDKDSTYTVYEADINDFFSVVHTQFVLC